MLPRFSGEIEQIPPMHSALKHQGRPLYEYARAGIEIDRPPRRVVIHRLAVVEWSPPRVVIEVQCSAGTYIRTLAQDIIASQQAEIEAMRGRLEALRNGRAAGGGEYPALTGTRGGGASYQ